MNIDIDVHVECAYCGASLVFVGSYRDGAIDIDVEPCSPCLADAEDEGKASEETHELETTAYNKGYHEGLEIGQQVGYKEGLEEYILDGGKL